MATSGGRFRIKAGDQVMVTAGKDRGKTGKVSKLYLAQDRALVEGVNQVKRHVRPTQKDPQGGIQMKPAPIHLSNLMLLDPKTNRPTRVGRKFVEGAKGKPGRWVRVSRKSGAVLDKV